MSQAVADFGTWMDERYSDIINPIVESIPRQEQEAKKLQEECNQRVFKL